MFQHILVPLDGSPAVERAIAVAARLALQTGGVVTLLHVIHPYWEPGAPVAGMQGLSGDDAEAMEAADYLADIRQRVVLSDVASREAIAVGSVVPAILTVARDEGADLVVMVQHRHRPLLRWAPNGTTQQVTRRARVPVLVLHEEDSDSLSSAAVCESAGLRAVHSPDSRRLRSE